MGKQGIYAYAVVSNSQLKMDSIFVVNYKNLSLIGKMVNISDFQKELQEVLKNPKTMESVLTEHQSFLDRLMRETTLVPFQFGTILKNKEGVIDHLKSSYTKYEKLLKKFKDREEWGIRVFADLKKFRAGLVQTNQENTHKSSSGIAYLLRKKQEEEAEKSTNEKLTSFSEEILNSLKELAFEYKISKSSQRFSEKGELLISVLAFLIVKSMTKKFNQKLVSLQKKYQELGLRLVSSGPWPAYNFLN